MRYTGNYKAAALYFFRSGVLVSIYTFIIFALFSERIAALGIAGYTEQLYFVVDLVGRIDVLRAIFMGMLPFCALLLFFPQTKTPAIFVWRIAGSILPAMFACLYFLIIVRNAGGADYDLVIGPYLIVVGLNLFLVLYHRLAGRNGASASVASKFAVGFPILGDALFPGLVESRYVGSNRFLHFFSRPTSLLPVVLPALGIFLCFPLPVDSMPSISDRFEKITPRFYEGKSTQYCALKSDGRLLMEIEGDLVDYDPDSRTLSGKVHMNSARAIWLMPDPGSDDLVALNHQNGVGERLTVFDGKSLDVKLEADLLLQNVKLHGGITTFFDRSRNLLLCFAEFNGLRIDLSTYEVTGEIEISGHYALHPKNPEFYTVDPWSGALTAHDANDLTELRRIVLPPMGERIVVDEKRNRLLIAYPAQGRIRVVDIDSWQVTGEISTLFGARCMAIDEKNGVFLVGSLAPYMEIRDLEDFSFVDRIEAPPWQRAIEIDSDRNVAFVTSPRGLFRLDLNGIGQRAFAKKLKALDPFFILLKIALPAGQKLLALLI